MRYDFEVVAAHRTRQGQCPICGRTVRRSRTFEMTVNPFNRNEDGTVRTRGEVQAAVEDKADAWSPDFRHAFCEVGESNG